MKKISILIPCYNEEGNVVPLSDKIVGIFETELVSYDYEIIFIDNCSTDNTKPLLREICKKNHRIKAVFNLNNRGVDYSTHHGFHQTTGDCTIFMFADFQEPVEMIPRFIEELEKGYKIVIGVKKTSHENKIVFFLRSIFYKIMKNVSNNRIIEHFHGFGLYDKSFVETLKTILCRPMPLRIVVSTSLSETKIILYEQQKRKTGKSNYNLYSLYQGAMSFLTLYQNAGLRFVTLIGFIMGVSAFLVSVIYFIYKLLYWDSFQIGMAPLIIGVFFLSSMQLFFIGIIGEYVMNMNSKINSMFYHPDYQPSVKEERINFDDQPTEH